MKHIWLALHGVSQSGKDTAAEFLIRHRGFYRIAFADPLRNGLYALNPQVYLTTEQITELGLTSIRKNYTQIINFTEQGSLFRLQTVVDLVGWDNAKQIPEIRELLQRYGTEAGRMIHGADCWLETASSVAENKNRVVFTDCRFINEAVWVRMKDGFVVKIHRPGIGRVNSHVSDSGLPEDLINYTLENNGTIGELHDKIEEIYNLVEKNA